MIKKLLFFILTGLIIAPVVLAIASNNEYIIILKDSQNQFDIDNIDEREDAIKENQAILLSEKDFKKAIEVGSGIKIKNSYGNINGFSAVVSDEYLEKLKNNRNVKYVYKPIIVYPSLDQSANIINATSAWDIESYGQKMTGKSQSVCVIDTGIDYTHEAFGSCTKSQFISGNCQKVPAGFDFANGDNDPMDEQGHGTHVSGIIASSHPIYRGIAPDASIVSVNIFGSSGFTTSELIIAGIDWCTTNAERQNISVISMSLGSFATYTDYCDSIDPGVTQAINAATAKNIAVVVAGGNSFDANGISFPACIKNSVAVGSTEKDDSISSFSNRNSLIDVFAPGGEIVSSIPLQFCFFCIIPGFESKSGTSMATPHVAGAFAILNQFGILEKNKVLTKDEIQSALSSTGKKIEDSLSGLQYSRIDILSALIFINKSFPSIPPKIEGYGIEIADIDIRIDGKKSSLSGSNIRKEAKPGSKIELEISVKNNFEFLELEDASIKAEIEDLDGNEDESKDFKLIPKSRKKSKLRFTIPNDAGEDTYRIIIEAEAKDEQGNEYLAEKKIKLDVEKEKHDLKITDFNLVPLAISCSRKLSLFYEISNRGSEDSEAEILIYSQNLDIEKTRNVIISEIAFSENLPLSIERSEPGNYEITLQVYFNDKLQDQKSAALKINECMQSKENHEKIILFTGSSGNTSLDKTSSANSLAAIKKISSNNQLPLSAEIKSIIILGAVLIAAVSFGFLAYFAKMQN